METTDDNGYSIQTDIDSPISVDTLSLMVTRLDTQARSLMDNTSIRQWHQKPMILSNGVPFKSLLQTYIELEGLCNSVIQLVKKDKFDAPEQSPAIIQEKDMYARKFAA
ncbi:hypothetical protein VTN77DRAFT_1336 [Rasamsonia byssochlamydoides]|uniref:uncharacterized protein n=1 Tax=Rasamsonia byssochlamydoides TaxID=89139 RepID=UPI0037426086